MTKTTIYLPDDLKAGITRLARATGWSEAEVIRDAIRRRVSPPKPTPAIIDDGDFDPTRMTEYLAGFGQG